MSRAAKAKAVWSEGGYRWTIEGLHSGRSVQSTLTVSVSREDQTEGIRDVVFGLQDVFWLLSDHPLRLSDDRYMVATGDKVYLTAPMLGMEHVRHGKAMTAVETVAIAREQFVDLVNGVDYAARLAGGAEEAEPLFPDEPGGTISFMKGMQASRPVAILHKNSLRCVWEIDQLMQDPVLAPISSTLEGETVPNLWVGEIAVDVDWRDGSDRQTYSIGSLRAAAVLALTREESDEDNASLGE